MALIKEERVSTPATTTHRARRTGTKASKSSPKKRVSKDAQAKEAANTPELKSSLPIIAKHIKDWDESDKKNYDAILRKKHEELVVVAAQRRNQEMTLALAKVPPPFLKLEAAPGAPPLSAVLPAVYDHYSRNSPDFSGAKMYKVEQDFMGPFNQLVQMAPENISIAILVGETQPQPWRKSFWLPQTLILELRASVYHTLNHKLANADKYLSPTLLMTVLALTRYEAFVNDSWAPARAHLMGIKEMMRSRPDLDLLPHPFLHFALCWCDRVCAMLSGQDPIFEKPTNAACNPASPLVAALVPKATDLQPGQWRRIMTSFYRCPGAELINILAKLTRLVPTLGHAASRKQSMDALRDVQTDLFQRTPDIYEGLLTFSDPRFAMQACTYEALRRAALLVVSAAIYRQSHTVTSRTDVDHGTMSIFMLDLQALVIHSPASALFVLCLAGPFTVGPVFDDAARIVADAAARLGLHQSSWHDVRTFLAFNAFYYPEIQDPGGPFFWDSSALHGTGLTDYRFYGTRPYV